jgi:antitoxin (DNA-binding transcriptional repressor) of toxin-antitoxin stability system
MCVIMTHMRTASIRQVQHNLSEVLGWVALGEEVQVLKRRKVVARLLPPEPIAVAAPDFCARARKVWGVRPKGKALSETASDARGER